MAKDDATKAQAAELEDIIKDGKKKTLNFVLMKSKDGVVLEGHPTKSPQALMPAAKEKGGLAGVSVSGTMNTVGKVIELSVVEEDPPENLPALARRHFKALGLRFNVAMLLPDGKRIGDGDPEPEDPLLPGATVPAAVAAPTAPAAPGAPQAAPPGPGGDDALDRLKALLSERIRALAPRVREALSAGIEGAATWGKGLQEAAARIAAGEVVQASRFLDAVEARLNTPAPVGTGASGGATEGASGEEGDLEGEDWEDEGEYEDDEGEDEDDDGEEGDDETGKGKGSKKKRKKKKGKKAPATGGPAPGPAVLPPASPDDLADDLVRRLPAAGREAKTALQGFDAVLKGAPFDSAAVRLASDAVKQRNADFERKMKAFQAANALDDTVADRAAQISKAKSEARAARTALREAEAVENATSGKALLVESLSVGGALAADTKPAYSEGAQAELIKGMARNPKVTGKAMQDAGTSAYREGMAQNLGKVLGHVESDFSGGGKSFVDREYAEAYGNRLLKAGADVGPGYFERLDDYVASGRQFLNDPMGIKNVRNFAANGQARSLHVGKSLVKADGSLDLDSAEAKAAIGDALFHPEAARNPMASLSEHMLGTLEMLRDPDNAREATATLKGIGTPSDPAAMGIVRKAHGKGDADPVGKGDVRSAVMASMLKPLDQGKVGSCFATAPGRRLRQEEPMVVMKAYAQIAGTGRFKPPHGPEVPIVTNLPPNEDPVQRSFEYSTATSTARRDGSDRSKKLADAMRPGLEGLSKDMKGFLEGKKKTAARTEKLVEMMKADFEFSYDPTSEVTDSNDGSSSKGRYVLTPTNQNQTLDTKDKFCEGVANAVVAKLKLDAKSKAAADVLKYVRSDAFVNAVCKDGYKPWEQSSGGKTEEATQTLFGADLAEKTMTKVSGKPLPDEGERTAEVLTGLVNMFRDSTAEMATILTKGKHGFNALPNHPSLAPLKGADDAETERKVKANLIDKGKALKDTVLPAAKAQSLYDQQAKDLIGAEKDAEVKALLEQGVGANRPAGDVTPAQLKAALDAAIAAATDRRADKREAEWVQEQTAAGKTIDPAKRTAAKEKSREASKKALSDAVATRLLREMEGPEFLIADTNWGSVRDHTFFVIAPDPVTGEPALWSKTVPPGKLSRKPRDWVDAKWANLE